MDSFEWTQDYVTGLAEVDQQHHRLVDLLNRLGSMVGEGSGARFEDMEAVFAELAAYTHDHFDQEEAFMVEVALDPGFVRAHRDMHQRFIVELGLLHARESPQNPDTVGQLLRFLSAWLAYHILGVDQSMARQVAGVRSGMSAGQAYQRESLPRGGAEAALLHALDSLFQQVTERNHELLQLNQTLEDRVAQRTRELSEAIQRLQDLALTDVLTGLPNRRHAMRNLAERWGDASEAGQPLSCMMIDADGFKQINDKFGHDAGDEVLRQLARTLKHQLRTDDQVARLGGDEFFVTLPRTSLEHAMALGEQLRETVAALRVNAGAGQWRGNISIGIAQNASTMADSDALVKLADRGLYQAKSRGRNCVSSMQVA